MKLVLEVEVEVVETVSRYVDCKNQEVVRVHIGNYEEEALIIRATDTDGVLGYNYRGTVYQNLEPFVERVIRECKDKILERVLRVSR